MAQDREQEIRLQFLEEAQEYLNKIESTLLGTATRPIDRADMDASLRAAHSIKGGAAMMQFDTLSHLAHRFEDFLKVLKTPQSSNIIDIELESLLLSAVDSLRRAIALCHRELTIPNYVKHVEIVPKPTSSPDPKTQWIFDQLYQRLGDPQAEELFTISDEGTDMVALLFETEVEGCLQRLETVIADPDQPCLLEELTILAQELGSLGEMLQLPAFTSLCESVIQQLTAEPEDLPTIAQAALDVWRRSQALVLVGQIAALPTALNLNQPAEEVLVLSESAQVSQANPDSLSFTEVNQAIATVPNSGHPLPEVASTQTLEVIAEAIASSPEVEPVENGKTQEQTVRVPVKQLNQLNDLFGELTIERNALSLHLERLHNLIGSLSHRVRTLEKSNLHLRAAYDEGSTQAALPSSVVLAAGGSHLETSAEIGYETGFDSLEMDRYNNLHSLSQTVMETIVQIQEVTSDIELSLQDTDRTSNDLTRTSKQLQTSLTQARMRPLTDLVSQFPRMLRDLSMQYGKSVECQIYGGSTLIDRTILDALKDPLLHLLRNAFDHGIEDAATRLAAGKPTTGRIEIRAAYRGNRTLITLTDDGGGIDLNRIRAQAQQQLGFSQEQLAELSETELLSLIFEPGFSTAAQVTALSGRGVGLDVVRTNLRQIRGDIKVETKPGVGSTFILSVPFTLSVMRVLLVESDGMLLAIPTDAVEEMLLLPVEAVITTVGREVFNWESMLVPLVRLNQCLAFHCPRRSTKPEATPMINTPNVLVLNQGSQWVGLQVDRCWGEQEVAVRQVEGAIAMPAGFTGCTVLGDGQVVPLLDAAELVDAIANRVTLSSFVASTATPETITASASHSSLSALSSSSTSSELSQKSTVLVVDDSINVRRFLALTLEKSGYQVEQARDGQEAI
ncbi:MAG TPA: hybrid sensor histidine kinase/response regulator, partial [Allocoleopsis sp.]